MIAWRKIVPYSLACFLLIFCFQNCSQIATPSHSTTSHSAADPTGDPTIIVYPTNPVPPGAQAEVIVSNIQFGEGPVYVPALQALLFSDISLNVTYQWSETSGLSQFRDHTNGANGNILDQNGNILSVAANGIVKIDPATKQVTNISQPQSGITYTQPNDLALYKDGSVYFTDYGGATVYRVTPSGVTTIVLSGESDPNGIKFSPDNSKLYVSYSTINEVRIYDVDGSGILTPAGLLHDAPDNVGSDADGLAVDVAGNVYVTGQDAVTVVSPDGTEVGHIPVGDTVTNVAFGGADYKTLFITSKQAVRKIGLLIPGVH